MSPAVLQVVLGHSSNGTEVMRLKRSEVVQLRAYRVCMAGLRLMYSVIQKRNPGWASKKLYVDAYERFLLLKIEQQIVSLCAFLEN